MNEFRKNFRIFFLFIFGYFLKFQIDINNIILFCQVLRILTEAGAEKYKPIFAKKNITFKELSFADEKTLKQVQEYFLNYCIVHYILLTSGLQGHLREWGMLEVKNSLLILVLKRKEMFFF